MKEREKKKERERINAAGANACTQIFMHVVLNQKMLTSRNVGDIFRLLTSSS